MDFSIHSVLSNLMRRGGFVESKRDAAPPWVASASGLTVIGG